MFDRMKPFLLILSLACGVFSFSQDSAASRGDSHFHIPSPPHKRVYVAAAGNLAVYGATVAALSNAWYSNYPQTRFHFFNDGRDWLQVDKAGHAFTTYTMGRMGMELWNWAGLPHRQRVWVGGLSGSLLLTVVEVLDGFSAGWGFSSSDFAANLAGSSIFIAQELGWQDQRIQLKYSFSRQNYGSAELDLRAEQLFGKSGLESMLKDYNSQTYWASLNLKSFFKHTNLPRWLNVAAGYGANGMLGGSENLARDANGNIIFDRRDIARYQQWYLAPDIDLTRIRTKHKWLKTTLFLLNSFKFPSPALCFSKYGIRWSWIQL